MSDGKFQCPVCGKLFNSREDYDSHAMAHHQSEAENNHGRAHRSTNYLKDRVCNAPNLVLARKNF